MRQHIYSFGRCVQPLAMETFLCPCTSCRTAVATSRFRKTVPSSQKLHSLARDKRSLPCFEMLPAKPNSQQHVSLGMFPCKNPSQRSFHMSHPILCEVVVSEGEARSINPAAVRQSGVLYLDTLAVATHLESQGFTHQQAEALTKALSDVISVGLEHQTKVMVTKPQQEVMVQQLLAQIASVKKDMVILEKSEFTMIRNDTEKQSIRISQLEDRLNDELKKLGGQVKLDINLEKSRAIEAVTADEEVQDSWLSNLFEQRVEHAINEKELQSLLNKIEVEHANHERDMKTLENKIDVEVSNLQTQNEKNRNDVQKYMIGILVSAATLYLGYLRLIA